MTNNYRICGDGQDKIAHIFSGCPALAKMEYIYRHGTVRIYIYWMLCKRYEIRIGKIIEKVTDKEKKTILVGMSIDIGRAMKTSNQI